MIPLLLTVFLVSLVGMLAMVIRKAISIRGLPTSDKPFILDATPHPHRIRKFILEITKEGVHIILMAFTRIWLIIGKEWRNMLKKHFPKIFSALYEHPALGERKESSFFLATITEYKEKTKRLRERMKKDESKTKKGDSIESKE